MPDKKDKPRREEYTEGSPYLDFPLLSSYEQTLFKYWIEAGQITQTAAGPVTITWGEIRDWADLFYSEQYVEWLEHPRPLRVDGLPDERFRAVSTPVVVSQRTLSDWELETIRRMSQEYVSEYSCKDPYRQCPIEINIEDMTEDDKLLNANAFESAIKSLFGPADQVPAV